MNVATLGASVGSLLVASWFAIALSGIILVQAYFYFRNRPENDSKLVPPVIAVICLLDLAHVVCIMATLYHYLVRHFGDENALHFLTPSLALTVGFTASITFIVQGVYAWRLWKLSQRKYLVPLIVAILTARLACGWTTTIKAIKLGTFLGFVTYLRWLFTAGVALAVAADVLITASLCFCLHGSRSGLHGLNDVIDHIIFYTLQNGILISLVSIVSLICVVIMPGNLIFIAVHFVISKLYINSLLSSLNSRKVFQDQRADLRAHKGTSLVVAAPQKLSRSDMSNSYPLQTSRPFSGVETDLRTVDSSVDDKFHFSPFPSYNFVITETRPSTESAVEETNVISVI